MKLSHQILIIFLIVASLFLVRRDVVQVYNNTVNYLGNKISNLTNKNDINSNNESNDLNNVKNTEDITKIPKTVESPGPLKVASRFVSVNSNANLSAKDIIAITNKFRAKNGDLPPLNENDKLDFSAEKKLQDMFVKQYFEHTSPDGVTIGDLGNQVSYDYITIGENLALGNFKSDEALVDAWMASAGHRANILNKNYMDIGVAVGKGKFNGKTVWIAVQHFGLPRNACPAVDSILEGVIKIKQDKIKQMEADLNLRKERINNRVVYGGLTTNEQIKEYNALVPVYNNLINELKSDIDKYNQEVRDFNDCIVKYTNLTSNSH